MYQTIAPVHHCADEVGIGFGSVEIAAAPRDEGLVDGVLEPVVSLLGDPVFMALAAIDAGGPEAVVPVASPENVTETLASGIRPNQR